MIIYDMNLLEYIRQPTSYGGNCVYSWHGNMYLCTPSERNDNQVRSNEKKTVLWFFITPLEHVGSINCTI